MGLLAYEGNSSASDAHHEDVVHGHADVLRVVQRRY